MPYRASIFFRIAWHDPNLPDKDDQNCSRNDPSWPEKIAQNCSNLLKFAQNCSKLLKIAQNCSKCLQMSQNVSKCLKMFQNVSQWANKCLKGWCSCIYRCESCHYLAIAVAGVYCCMGLRSVSIEPGSCPLLRSEPSIVSFDWQGSLVIRLVAIVQINGLSRKKRIALIGKKPFMPAVSFASLLPLGDTTVRHELLGFFAIWKVADLNLTDLHPKLRTVNYKARTHPFHIAWVKIPGHSKWSLYISVGFWKLPNKKNAAFGHGQLPIPPSEA